MTRGVRRVMRGFVAALLERLTQCTRVGHNLVTGTAVTAAAAAAVTAAKLATITEAGHWMQCWNAELGPFLYLVITIHAPPSRQTTAQLSPKTAPHTTQTLEPPTTHTHTPAVGMP
jgi:hypothetical protein